jgi:hypothetical protein
MMIGAFSMLKIGLLFSMFSASIEYSTAFYPLASLCGSIFTTKRDSAQSHKFEMNHMKQTSFYPTARTFCNIDLGGRLKTRLFSSKYSSDDDYSGDDVSYADPVTGVVGGGALRGEQDFYSMRDLQKMRVTRLKSMCEARCSGIRQFESI